MRKFHAALIACVAVTALATSAHAQSDSNFSAAIGYQNGDYGDLGKGLGSVDLSGRYAFTQYISVEGDLGLGTGSKTTDFQGVSADTKLENTLGLYAVGSYPIPMAKNLEVFARLGFTQAKIKADGFVSQNDTGATLGVGVRYFPGGGKNGIELGYNHIDLRWNGQANIGQVSYVRRF